MPSQRTCLVCRPRPQLGVSVQEGTNGCFSPFLLLSVKINLRGRDKNQDGGVGRHTVPPPTTRTDRKSNGKEARHQGNKKLTFIQTSRRGGDGQLGRRGLLLPWQDWDWRSVGRTGQAVWTLADPAAPHSLTDKPTNGREGSRPRNPGLQHGEIKPQTFDWKRSWGLGRQQERLPASLRGHWRDPQGPRVCTGPPTREPAPEGPNLIVGVGVKDWNPEESEVGAIAPSRPLPHVQHHSTAELPRPGEHLRLRPLK